MMAIAISYGTISWELWKQTHIGEINQRQINSMLSKRRVRSFLMLVSL